MSLPIRFLPHSVQILTPTVASTWINQIDATTPNSGVTLFEESTGSQTDREFVAAKGIAPTLPLTTSDLTILTTVGFSGLLIACGAGTPGLVAWGRELPLGALPTAIATAHHLQLAMSDGILVPQNIRASHNAIAKLSLMAHGVLGTTTTYSGATPFVFTKSVAITSGAGQAAYFFTLGPCKWTVSGGSSQLLQGLSDGGVDFGIQVLTESSDGDVYPSHVSIISRMTRFTFTTKDAEQIAAIGDGISVSAFAQYFRMVAASGQRVAPATATHVSIAGTAGMITPDNLSLTHKASGSASFTYTPALNTNLITISAAAAIPTS